MLDTFRQENRVYCSRMFSMWTCLPLLMFMTQWFMFCALVVHQVRVYTDGWCPNNAMPEAKVLMGAIALLYFTRSFFLWDNLVNRSNRQPVVSAWYTTFDAVQEFMFTLLVYW